MVQTDVKAILSELKPGVDFETECKLIDDGILESLDIVSLIGALNDEFDIEISVIDIVPENFNSLSAICNLVERLLDE